MYVIFEDGSRQYRVSVGDTVRLDHRDVEVGSTIELDRVLLCADGANVVVGQPTVGGAKVIAEVTGYKKTKTVTQQFRRRKNYRKLRGHTQPFLEVKIKEIVK